MKCCWCSQATPFKLQLSIYTKRIKYSAMRVKHSDMCSISRLASKLKLGELTYRGPVKYRKLVGD